jgi:hypothetical protein
MATIVQKPSVQVSATFQYNEEELRALDALVGYGTKEFLETFYKHMGKAYLEPHEKALVSLFENIRSTVPGILSRADRARKSFNEN